MKVKSRIRICNNVIPDPQHCPVPTSIAVCLLQGMNVSQTTLFFSEFGRVGRVFLQPDARTAAAKEGFRWGPLLSAQLGILGHQTLNVVFTGV